jgi:hypothetical protein
MLVEQNVVFIGALTQTDPITGTNDRFGASRTLANRINRDVA